MPLRSGASSSPTSLPLTFSTTPLEFLSATPFPPPASWRNSSLARRLPGWPADEHSLSAWPIGSAIGIRGAGRSAPVPGRSRLIDTRVHRACTGSAAAAVSHRTGLVDSGVDCTSTRCAHARRRCSSGSGRTRDTAHRNTGGRAVDHRRGSRRTSHAAGGNARRRTVDLRLSDGGDGTEARGPDELRESVSHCMLLANECGRSILPHIPIGHPRLRQCCAPAVTDVIPDARQSTARGPGEIQGGS